MKTAGIVLLCLGGLMILSGANLALTQYDLRDSHDLSKCLGSMGISALIATVGLALLLNELKKEKNARLSSRKAAASSSAGPQRKSSGPPPLPKKTPPPLPTEKTEQEEIDR